MTIISKPEEWPLEFYPVVETPTENVLSHYTLVEEYDGGFLLFHTISWSMYFLSKDEYDNLLNNEILKHYKVVLDKSIDETPIAEKVYIERSETGKEFTFDNIRGCVLMTTSNCNARCGYCYEKEIVPIGMTKKTADDVIDFIEKHKDTNFPIHIRWFGGEPLLNTKIIDYIVHRFHEDGIEFISDIVTNAYLANEETSKKFDYWKIKAAQITIDGVGKKYNEIKRYKGNDTNPFQTVINNVWNIIRNSNANVSIRVNVSEDNINDLDETLSYLTNIFSNEPRIGIYTSLIYQIMTNDDVEISDGYTQRVREIVKKYPSVTQHDDNAPIKKKFLRHCSSDIGSWVVINPQGKFGVCEHWNDGEIIGDVVNGITNREKAEEWRKKGGKNTEMCVKNKCPLLPVCEHFYKCVPNFVCVNNAMIKNKIEKKKKGVINTYNYWKEKYGKRE